MPHVLHILSQRPGRTGSGVTLDQLVRHAARAGWSQTAIVGVPAEDASPSVGDLEPDDVRPLRFGTPSLPFEVPGMSDVMPYPSSRFGTMTPEEIGRYRRAWSDHIAKGCAEVGPDVIHAHHLWIVSSLLRDIAGDRPIVLHCHATGLRQMALCPGLAADVISGCRPVDRIVALHREQADRIVRALDVPPDRVAIVGAGYDADVFRADLRAPSEVPSIAYVGKLSRAKGVPELIAASLELLGEFPGLRLHLVGGGAGREADEIRAEAGRHAHVELHGPLPPPSVARVLGNSWTFALPSFYEGLPLVLVEAFAMGCRVVATALPVVEAELRGTLGDALHPVPLPALASTDVIDEAARPAFLADLAQALREALRRGPGGTPPPAALRAWTWESWFDRVEATWRAALATR